MRQLHIAARAKLFFCSDYTSSYQLFIIILCSERLHAYWPRRVCGLLSKQKFKSNAWNSWSITTPGIYWILLRFLPCIITINDLINGNKNRPIVFSFAPFRQSRITAVLAAKIKAATEKEVQLFDKKFTPLFSRLQQIIQVKEIRKTLLFPCRSTLSKFH